MITIKNAKTISGRIITQEIESPHDIEIDATGLTLLPALTDPHVHFRTPGFSYKEDWETGSLAAIYGGVTTVFDMPNTSPATVTAEALREKKKLIDTQTKINYGLFFGADKNHFDEIALVRDDVVGIKIYMGSTTGDLTMDDNSSLHAAFALAAAHDLLIVVHAEDEEMIRKNHRESSDFHTHTAIRTPEVACRATENAIALARLYNARLCIAHVSTKEEIPIIARAKGEGVKLYAETSPHHLFLTSDAYDTIGAKAQVNPPIRTRDHGEALLEAVEEGIIDTIGSDHAPHTLEEKSLPYGKAPSGIPGIQTMLPLLLNAVNEGRLSLHRVVDCCCTMPRTLFGLSPTEDWVLVDMNEERTVLDEEMQSKAKWSPFAGWALKGWPKYTICKGELYTL